EKYSSYSSEIIRLSLVGIAGYGFIISNILMKTLELSNKPGDTISKMSLPASNFIISVAGVAFFGISLGLSLYHRFRITSCLYDQILISRSLLRLKNSHWTETEKDAEKQVLAKIRECQKIESRRYENILFWSGLFLFAGFFCIVILFFLILTDLF
ncbi:MAG: hypothetical protein ABW019_13915, partial [Chitinophagaceae bacterium]